jgi:ADP-ribose pyrophosphatase
MLEQRKASRRIYEGRVINVRVDDVTLEDGAQATREVVEHHGAVALVAMPDREHVVLVRQYRYAVSSELFEIPAGTLETGEESAECARRELEEETGFKCKELTKILEIYMAPGYTTEKVHVYLARKLGRSSMKLEEDERIKNETVLFADALAMIRSGKICDAKSVCGLYRAREFVA